MLRKMNLSLLSIKNYVFSLTNIFAKSDYITNKKTYADLPKSAIWLKYIILYMPLCTIVATKFE